MKIIIESRPKEDMRYDTLGDWFYDESGTLIIQVAEPNPQYDILIAIHELIEAVMCRARGISQEQVDRFDMTGPAFDDFGEPGDDMNCPYRREHRFAMLVEHLVAHELGLAGYGRVE